jgi:hypothetical protein
MVAKMAQIGHGSVQTILEGSRIDANPLSFSFDTDLAKNGSGGVIVQVAPGPQVDEKAWLELISTESDHDIARRLGITDRQVRRIKTGQVSQRSSPPRAREV